MVVSVSAQGHLQNFRPSGRSVFTIELPAGAKVIDLIHASGIPWEEIGLVAINGQQAGDDTALSDGDEVMLLAPLEGG